MAVTSSKILAVLGRRCSYSTCGTEKKLDMLVFLMLQTNSIRCAGMWHLLYACLGLVPEEEELEGGKVAITLFLEPMELLHCQFQNFCFF